MSAGKLIVVLSLSSMWLSACGDRAIPEDAAARDAAIAETFALSVDLALSEAAKQRMDAAGETVIVSAMYFAGGRAGIAESEFNDVGLIDLGRMEVEHVGEGRVVVDGDSVRRDRLDLIEGEPQVNVNVFSGRRSSPDNILACGMFQDDVRVAVRAPIQIACRLIAEGDDAQP